MNEEKSKPSAEAESPKRAPWRLVLELGLGLAVIVLGAMLLFGPGPLIPAPTPEPTAAPTPAPTPDPTPEPTPVPLTLRFHGPKETLSCYVAPGDFFRPEEAPLEGYTFLRWQNAEGEAFPAAGAAVWEDGDYYPVYAMRLGRADHGAYLSLDEKGAFHPSAALSRREAVAVLYYLLDTELVGDGQFLDLPETDPLYPAAATLKQLGILSGSRLHPDESITRQEFLAMLCGFFPEGTEEITFADLGEQDPLYPLFRTAAERGWIESGEEVPARPDEELSRMEFVCIMDKVLDRCGDQERRREMVGTFLDIDLDDPHYWEVAEAVIPHSAEGEGEEERWMDSQALPLREEGLFFLGTELHAIDEKGNPVVNGEFAGLFFDGDGIETSGDAELDRLIRELLPTLVEPETQSGEEMLRILFDHTVLQYRYRPGDFYPLGEPSGWESAEALSMLQEGRGNCYAFAALYRELARAVGYDARAYTGAVIGGRDAENPKDYVDRYGNPLDIPYNRCPHGWVEIEFDGVPYIFDPEYAYRRYVKGIKAYGFFKLDEEERARFGYLTEWENPQKAGQ